MPNDKGRYNQAEVIETRLPYWVNLSKGWTHKPYSFAILITKTRCKEFGVPILSNGNEKPSAFRYAAAAGTGTGDNQHRYYALYDRTEAFLAGGIDRSKLFPFEIMGEERNLRTFGFMNNDGDLSFAKFTDEQIRVGELRAHIDHMQKEGFTYMGEEAIAS